MPLLLQRNTVMHIQVTIPTGRTMILTTPKALTAYFTKPMPVQLPGS
ncbi:MAG: hypothetical protein NVV67_07420 [Pseudoxanthomonas sp.]|nr:hypothetical protein [Pseudoxanthomonas sp.]